MKNFFKFNLVRSLIAVGVLLIFLSGEKGSEFAYILSGESVNLSFLRIIGFIVFLLGPVVWIYRKITGKTKDNETEKLEEEKEEIKTTIFWASPLAWIFMKTGLGMKKKVDSQSKNIDYLEKTKKRLIIWQIALIIIISILFAIGYYESVNAPIDEFYFGLDTLIYLVVFYVTLHLLFVKGMKSQMIAKKLKNLGNGYITLKILGVIAILIPALVVLSIILIIINLNAYDWFGANSISF